MVTGTAALVISGVISINLFARGRKSMYERVNEVSKDVAKREAIDE